MRRREKWAMLAVLGGLVAACWPFAATPGWAQPGTASAPVEQPAAEAPAGKDRDIVRVGQPWLRINVPGHTAAVQALEFSPDSRRLFSAGLDKVVQVWDLAAMPASGKVRDLKRNFLRERTIRWQVSRGPRGSIYALAASPTEDLLAFGGYGAMGSTGEILLVHPADGTLVQVLEGHRQSICGLAFGADGKTLVSLDTDGQCRLWRRGEKDWTSEVLQETDTKVHGAELAAIIQRQPLVRPLAVAAGNLWLAVPQPAKRPEQLTWRLQQWSLATGKVTRTLDVPHPGVTTALAITPDGRQLASADLAGNLNVWDLNGPAAPARLPAGRVIRSLALSPDGKTLAAGSAANGGSQLQLWDVAAGKTTSTRALEDHVQACRFSPDGKWFAYVGGRKNQVFVDRVALADAPSIALPGSSRKIMKVVFAAEKPFERVAFGTQYRAGGWNNNAELTEQFDPARGRASTQPQQPADWLPTDWLAGTWRVEPTADRASLRLFEGNAPRGSVALNVALQGHARCSCWIPGTNGKPIALAVGTDQQNLVCVFQVTPQGAGPLLRQFRGHQDVVLSLAVSRDLRLLVSGSADGTLQYWSLSEFQSPATVGRWGAALQVADGKLNVQAINAAGPLFHKGVRRGDRVSRIAWFDGQQERETRDPQQILSRLTDLDWYTQVSFTVERDTRAPLQFQLVPAWQALASVFVDDSGQWAFWTPEGYFDASVNGHTLFGWQVNRGSQSLPQFYRADQFRRTLERPDVMRQLLPSGSLDAALASAREVVTVTPDQVLAAQIASTPKVTILSPRSGDVVAAGKARVRAEVVLPADGRVSRTRVFANGVVASQHQVVEQGAEGGQQRVVYEWDAALPQEERNLIEVFVLTEAKTSASENVVIQQRELPPVVPRRMYLLGVGVNKYQDAGIESLDYSVADAEALIRSLAQASRGLYEVMPPVMLTGEAVTRGQWQSTLADLNARLKAEAKPDDLLVIFMAGHGEVDPRTQVYHYICQDAKLDTLLDGSETISWDDFRVLSDISCRKLALLDTCHSGAIQGVRTQNKFATREFQENLIFTLAAAAGDEASQERPDWQHGAFTKSLLDGLAGSADASSDGVITLAELVDYTHSTVPKMTAEQQHPTAAPADLLEYVSLPLARGAAEAARTSTVAPAGP